MKKIILSFIFCLFTILPCYAINPKAESFLNYGVKEYNANNYPTAIAYYKKALKYAPDNYYAYLYLGCAEMEMQNYISAIQDFSAAISADSTHYEPYYYRAKTECKLKDFASAKRDFSIVINLMPDDPWPYLYRSQVEIAMNDKNDAYYDNMTFNDLAPYMRTYMNNVESILKSNWLADKSKSDETIVNFSINKNGNISNINIIKPSKMPINDQYAMAAVKNSKLPQLPKEIGNENTINVMFKFRIENKSILDL